MTRGMKSNKNKAAIYVRRSATDARDVHGPNRSIASQRRDIEDLAKRHNLDIVKIYEERVGTSASHLEDNARLSDTNPGLRTKSSSGYPVMVISGKIARSQSSRFGKTS